jgi:glycosyltransferase involved in cell wall biosynthesis
MKILFVHDRLGAHGGAESNLRHTAAALGRRGHVVGLLHGPSTGRDEAAWRSSFAQCLPLGSGASVASALAEFRPDLAYLHNLAALEPLAVLANAPVPVVRMVHDHQLYCLRGCKYPSWSRRPCTRALSPFCVFPCGGSIARAPGAWPPARWVSYAAKRRELAFNRGFRRLLVASAAMRTELLRNGIAPEKIEICAPVPPLAAAVPAEAPAEVPRIVYAGQIVRGKGVDVLLESLARVRAAFECVIIGDGHHRAYCEALSRRLGLAGRVRFTGFLPEAELPRHYAGARLAVMSSVWPEPFGLAGLEAMRHGLPVVAFDVGGVGEWLHEGVTGFLVPWMDVDAFAARITQLLENPGLARHLGEGGRTVAAGRFAFAGYIDRLERLLAQAAHNLGGVAA